MGTAHRDHPMPVLIFHFVDRRDLPFSGIEYPESQYP